MDREELMAETTVTGTHIWYYYICKRQVWFLSRNIVPDQEDENILIGRFLQEFSYTREKKEVSLGSVKFDIVKRKDGKILVGEVKKSSRFLESAKMQLAFYLKTLAEYGISAEGQILVPSEKMREPVVLTDDLRDLLNQAEQEIRSIILQDKPPLPVKNKYCRKCAYGDFCKI